MAHNTIGQWFLDAMGFTTFVLGIVTVQYVMIILGGLASIAAIVNHVDAYLDRRKNKKRK